MTKLLLDILTLLVAILHFWFMILEMFLWKNPIGMRVFRSTPEKAEITAVLAANQGLYNGFLASGLGISFFLENPSTAQTFRVFFLGCVLVAGIFGALTVSRRIFFVQGLPAALALASLYLANS